MLVPGTHRVDEPVLARPLGLATKLLVKLVERPEDQRRCGVEEDREQGQPQKKSGKGNGQPVVQSHQFSRRAAAARRKQMGTRPAHHTRAGWCRYRWLSMTKAKMIPATKVSRPLSGLAQ